MEKWAEQFYTPFWTRTLRRWLSDNRGNLPNIDELVDDMRQEAVTKLFNQINNNPSVEISNALFLTVFKNALLDHYRKYTGHLRAPEELKDKLADDKLANDLFKRICLYGDSTEEATNKIRLLVERGERSYSFERELIVEGIRFIKNNGICKPPRMSLSIDGNPASDNEDGGYYAGELANDAPEPDEQSELGEIRGLIQAVLARQSDHVQSSFEQVHRKFQADNVITDEQMLILRMYSTGEKPTDATVGRACNLPPHTVKRRRDQAFVSIRQWLVNNGLGDILDDL